MIAENTLVGAAISYLVESQGRGWRWSMFPSCCDSGGETFVVTVWRHETGGKQRHPFTGKTPASALARAVDWLVQIP